MGDTNRDTQRLAGQQMSHGEGGGHQARSHALAARGGGGEGGGGGRAGILGVRERRKG